MKRNIFIVLTLALVCVLFVACGKEETPVNVAIGELQAARENIDNQIAALEAQNMARVEATAEIEAVVFTLPNPDDFDGEYPRLGWTRRELSQNPGYLAERLAYLEIIGYQDVAEMTNYLGTHPDDLTKLVYSYWDYILFVDRLTPRMGAGAEDAAKQTPSATEPIRACVSEFIT